MTSTWRRTLSYLGLAPDEEYEDYDRYDDPTSPPSMSQGMGAQGMTQQVPHVGGGGSQNHAGSHNHSGTHSAVSTDSEPVGRVSSVRPVSVVDGDPSGEFSSGASPTERSMTRSGGSNGASSAAADNGSVQGNNVRSITTAATQVKPVVLSPAAFGDAKTVGDHFKNERPVIMNLQGADRDLRRRLIDFASGICYGLGGQMTRVAKEIFLLTPADVEVSEEDQRKLAEHGLYEV